MGAIPYHFIMLHFERRELKILSTTLWFTSHELKLLSVLVHLCHVSSSQKRNSIWVRCPYPSPMNYDQGTGSPRRGVSTWISKAVLGQGKMVRRWVKITRGIFLEEGNKEVTIWEEKRVPGSTAGRQAPKLEKESKKNMSMVYELIFGPCIFHLG